MDTRSALLSYVVSRGGGTVAQLRAALELSDGTVRRHLDKLALDGLLSAHLVRQSTGRPYRVYQATDAGVRQERDHSADLAARLLSQIQREGGQPAALAEGLAEALVANHRSEVTADAPLQQRVERTVAALQGEGILDGWERTSEGFLLHNHACPYRSAADTNDCVCESDRLAIEKLVGARVQQIGSVARGDGSCEYLVDLKAVAADAAVPEGETINP